MKQNRQKQNDKEEQEMNMMNSYVNVEETLPLWDNPEEEERTIIPKKKSIVLVNLATGEKYACMTSGSLVLGRDGKRCDVDLTDTDQYMSGVHVKLIVSDGRLYAEDMGSKNGTYLNSRKIRKREELRVGDVLKLGHSEFRLQRLY